MTTSASSSSTAPPAGSSAAATEGPSPNPVSPTVVPGFSTSSMWAASGVPDVSVAGLRIPPFLLPVYKAAGRRYGVPWVVLAAINEVETDFGRNVAMSSAGAVGWMQFLPSSWEIYGVDADGDGVADPGSPVDAIFAAARYLRAAGADQDLRQAIFAYNHADWYVDSVLLRSAQIAALPDRVVGSFTDLAEGRFPVAAHATYAAGAGGARITARRGAPVVAVKAGRIVRMGQSERLGRFVRLKSRSGVIYTFAHLGRVGRGGSPAKVRLYARRANGIRLSRLRPGTRVPAGAVLGRMSWTGSGGSAHMVFQIRTAGRGARRVDPVPFLAGWRLLQRAGADRFGRMSDGALAARVLADPRIEIYACGREDIQAGQIDRRVLATLELLAASGLRPTVSALKCGHAVMTTSGNVSEHSTGDAVDISAINGTPIAGSQGPGSITEIVIRRLLTLQGAMRPHQIISLMQFEGAPNTLAMTDHADHIHVGWRPEPTSVPALAESP